MDRRSFIGGTLTGVSGTALAGVASTLMGSSARNRPPAAPAQPQAPPPALPPFARLSFSQQGEDIVLYHLLHDAMKIASPTYLDIGAGDPVESNNTYLLHWNGGHGVLVEPNPAHQERLRKLRPHDLIVQAGVGVGEATEADYYVIGGNPALNTFSASDVAVRRREAGGEVVEQVIKMPLVRVNDLIAQHFDRPPDLLSIDVEGWDLAILRTLDFRRFRPAVVIAESLPAGPIARFLRSKRYELRGASMYNAIFADPKRYADAGVTS
jgi:FkbM family methyltransferase